MRVRLTTVAVLAFSGAALAQQGGTEQEARAMLDKAIAAVKADQVVAIIKFTKGEDGFLDRDLYPFCFRSQTPRRSRRRKRSRLALMFARSKTIRATPTAKRFMPPRRNRKAKSPKSSRICFPSPAPQSRCFQKSASSRKLAS